MRAFYNEIDRYCCDWLSNLMDAGLIAPGKIDDRSIADIGPDDVAGFERVHFFAGIGGWDHALNLAGWNGPVWTGSCPCQPFSAAGKRKGTADDRHLWPEFFRLISKCGPAMVFGEQVASKDGRSWLHAVRTDMESVGYAVGAADIGSAGVGAPHIRQRLYWVGHALRYGAGSVAGNRDRAQETADGNDRRASRACVTTRDTGATVGVAKSDQGQRGRLSNREGRERDGQAAGRVESNGQSESGGDVCGLADADLDASSRWGIQRPGQSDGAGARAPLERPAGLCADGRVAYSDGGQPGDRDLQRSGQHGQQPQDGGASERMADSALDGRRQERENSQGQSVGNRAQGFAAGLESSGNVVGVDNSAGARHVGPEQDAETDSRDETRLRVSGEGRGTSRPRPLNGFWRDADWLYCRDNKWRPVEPGAQPLVDGIPGRVGRLRAYGNAITPQVAAEFIAAYRDLTPPQFPQPFARSVTG